MDPATLAELREKLVKEKSRLSRYVGEAGEIVRSEEGSDSGPGGMGNALADLASDLYEREEALGLQQDWQYLMGEIDAALHRMDLGTYGISEISGEPIPVERLQIIPWARNRVEEESQKPH